MKITTKEQAQSELLNAWPTIKQECLSVLGSELHYQAMIYHALRTTGDVPIDQLGMNVKIWVTELVTDYFKMLREKKHRDYSKGLETIPDVVIFRPEIEGNWQRRNRKNTALNLLLCAEVKASERAGGRLRCGEVEKDIKKLCAFREEVLEKGGNDFLPVMIVIDSARSTSERMTEYSLNASREMADNECVLFLYVSEDGEREMGV